MPLIYMYQLYSLLLSLGFVVLLPRFLFDALRHGKYVAGFRERLGSLETSSIERPVIWLHCVSVGETQAARPLADLIGKQYPGHSLVVSTITLTGQTLARQVFKDHASRVFYFPFDWRWSVRRSLRTIQPAAVLLMETELWPNFLRECGAQRIPVCLVNGRISETSVRRYRVIRAFFKRVVENLTLAIMQTEADADRLQSLGFPEEKLYVSGTMKFDAGNLMISSSLYEIFRERFGLTKEQPLILAASTHAPEEQIIIESFRLLQDRLKQKPRLMLAPRHPERFAEVASLLKSSGLSWMRRSELESDLDKQCDAILLDSIGELPAIYPLASVVFVGGSIANFGGHNILEPATVASCIITGAHTHNFEMIVNDFVKARALIQLPTLKDEPMILELTKVLETMLVDSEKRARLGKQAALLVQQNLGATERTLKLIEPLLDTPGSHTQRDSLAREA
jgi:3-deoxy-D-manno-octulosonic-acid transferase